MLCVEVQREIGGDYFHVGYMRSLSSNEWFVDDYMASLPRISNIRYIARPWNREFLNLSTRDIYRSQRMDRPCLDMF